MNSPTVCLPPLLLNMTQANHYTADLIERIDVSANLAVFRFRPVEQLSFAAGQYATIGVAIDGGVIERPYSIVSSPYEPFLEFFVELVPGGDLTPKLWELKLGSSILIRRRIVGHFSLETRLNRHLMLATVTGVAPFVSMLRTQQIERGAESRERFLLIHSASRSVDLGPYLGELEGLSRSGWLRYLPTISRPWEEPDWKGEMGRLEDVVRKHADRLGFDCTNTVAYACGHPGMVENVKGLLARACFPKEKIREEEYFKLHDSCPPAKQALPVDQNLASVVDQGSSRSATRPVLG